ncbi:MAG: type II toxin-antitoxin system VapC family toxin [Candidatus Latescibacteria bacterium]|nr:type II toxin-antitoxin system VapC family toxin [Candidatus Latescibacterota bacterium]
MAERYLIDTNIIIYFFKDDFSEKEVERLSEIFDTSFNLSVIAQIEFLGWRGFTEEQFIQASQFLDSANIIPIDKNVAEQTIRLMRQQKIKLPDAIIAATCILHNFILVTRNFKDFTGVTDLTLLNPFSEDSYID